MYHVRYKPKSARGLFGTSTHHNLMSNDNHKGSSETNTNYTKLVDEGTNDFSKAKGFMSSRPGEPLHQPIPLGVSLVLRETKE